MSKKSAKIADLIESCRGRDLPAHYLGYFECFNQGLYYEAHDVLEELWLTRRHAPEFDFYKGLIQFAGAFVHLQKNRLRPAVALFRLSQSYLGRYPAEYERLNVLNVLKVADEWVARIESADFRMNPLERYAAPKMEVSFSHRA